MDLIDFLNLNLLPGYPELLLFVPQFLFSHSADCAYPPTTSLFVCFTDLRVVIYWCRLVVQSAKYGVVASDLPQPYCTMCKSEAALNGTQNLATPSQRLFHPFQEQTGNRFSFADHSEPTRKPPLFAIVSSHHISGKKLI